MSKLKNTLLLLLTIFFAALYPAAAQNQDYDIVHIIDDEPDETESSSIGQQDAVPQAQDGLSWTNPETGYAALILDGEKLLDSYQEGQLLEQMKGVTQWGDALFVTARSAAGMRPAEFARQTFGSLAGPQRNGTLFLIDMGARQLRIHSDGEVYRTVTNDKADSICDNVYSYASAADYYGTAAEVFSEVTMLLKGQKIREPMKAADNILLALVLALFFCSLFLPRIEEAKAAKKARPVFKGWISNVKVEPGNLHRQIINTGGSGKTSGGSSFSGGGRSGGYSGGGGGGHSF